MSTKLSMAEEGSIDVRMNVKMAQRAILAALENGDRVLEDSKWLFDCDRFPTSYALAVLGQEEYAKALLLSLVYKGAVPWSSYVQRALTDHICKQLLAVVLEGRSQQPQAGRSDMQNVARIDWQQGRCAAEKHREQVQRDRAQHDGLRPSGRNTLGQARGAIFQRCAGGRRGLTPAE